MKKAKMALTDDCLSEQFALRWNNFSYNLSSGFSSHLNDKSLVDVTLAVEGQLLEAHKLVLSVCSPYFESIFKSNPCQHPVLILQDMKYSEVDALVKFMYQGEISVKQEDLARFLKVAEVLKVKGLTLDTTTLQTPPSTNNSNPPRNSDKSETKEICHNNDMVPKKRPKTTEEKKTSKQYNDLSTRPIKRIKTSSTPRNISTDGESIPKLSSEIANKNGVVNENQSIIPNEHRPVENLNNMETYSNDESIDLTQDDEGNNDDEFNVIYESLPAEIVNNSLQEPPDIEPVTYKLSARGRPQLVHGGYVYNLTSRSAVLNRSHYRCAEQHHGCRGKCAVIAERFIPTGVTDHNHSPCYPTEDDYIKKIHTELNESL